MTKKYTPGPWVIYDTGFGTSHIRGSNEKEDPYYLAQVFTGTLWKKNGEANARLISCAPELLEALEKIVNCLQDGYMPSEIEEYAVNIIRKAKGE